MTVKKPKQTTEEEIRAYTLENSNPKTLQSSSPTTALTGVLLRT